jgi:hypothetical protein
VRARDRAEIDSAVVVENAFRLDDAFVSGQPSDWEGSRMRFDPPAPVAGEIELASHVSTPPFTG